MEGEKGERREREGRGKGIAPQKKNPGAATASSCQSRPTTHNSSTSASDSHSTDTLAETQATANPLQAAIVYAHDCHLLMPIYIL